jgi:hypothetical protein
MKISSRISLVTALLGATLGATSFCQPAKAQDKPERPAWELRTAYLQAVGLHMADSMPSVLDVMRYHTGVTTHQEITIEWNLITKADRPVERGAVVEGSLAHEFTLVERKHGVKGNARSSTLTLSDMCLVTAAVTSSGEVRGLVVGPGSPIVFGETFHNNRNQSGGHTLVFPKMTFFVFLPEDSKIDKLIFLLAYPNRDQYRLEQVGSLELGPKKNPN